MIPKIILLNGPSSSGKSTLSKALQKALREMKNEEYDIVSIDDFLKMSAQDVIYETDVYEISPQICKAALESMKAGHGAIMDHVITSERIYEQLLDALEGYGLLRVHVTCPLQELKKREMQRKDRCIGSAEASYEYLYPRDGYDLTVDTAACRTEEIIRKITGLCSKKQLLFYDAYEEFYEMTSGSNAFRAFCKDAFGEDFSQDGFSDVSQIDMILKYVPAKEAVHILDIGCGNGKMLGYLQQKTGAHIYGFDYSGQAIKAAQALFPMNAEFKEGIIGEIEYPEEKFDVITSMDTMYFAKDMTAFVAQIKRWLKSDGVFFAGYQEGDVMPKTPNVQTAQLTKALEQNQMIYEVTDITEQTYELLKAKRRAAIAHGTAFAAEGHKNWFDMLMQQTECATEPYEQFREKMARYIYVIRK